MLRARRAWPVAVALSVIGLVFLVAAVIWVYGVYSMSDPAKPLLVGVRFDGTRLSVKSPTCSTDSITGVEVFASESEQSLWKATGPKTAEGRRGTLTLWDTTEFTKPGSAAQPKELPKELDVLITYAGAGESTGIVFEPSAVKVANVTVGNFWTPDGIMSAKEIDDQLDCRK